VAKRGIKKIKKRGGGFKGVDTRKDFIGGANKREGWGVEKKRPGSPPFSVFCTLKRELRLTRRFVLELSKQLRKKLFSKSRNPHNSDQPQSQGGGPNSDTQRKQKRGGEKKGLAKGEGKHRGLI